MFCEVLGIRSFMGVKRAILGYCTCVTCDKLLLWLLGLLLWLLGL